MKRILISFATIGMMGFVSCNSGAPGNQREWEQLTEQEQFLVGKWNPVHWVTSYTVDGELVERDVNVNANRIFEVDGTGYESHNFGLDGKDDWQPLYSFKWSLADDKILFSDVKFTPPEGVQFGPSEKEFETEWSVIDLTSKEMKVKFSQKSLIEPVERFDSFVIFQK